MKQGTFSIAVIMLWAIGCLASTLAGEKGALPDNRDYWRGIEAARRANRLSTAKGPPSANIREAIQAIDKAEVAPACCAYPIVAMLRCRLYYLSGYGQSDVRMEARRRFADLLSSASVAPECLVTLSEFGNQDQPPLPSNELERSIARLLPLSWWSWMADFRDSGISVDMKPLPPGTPFGDVKAMVEIAERFERLGLYSLARKAYVEAIYGGLRPNWVVIGDSPKEKTWLSPDTAVLWQRTAEDAWKAGEHSLAYEYLAKSAIFGPESQVDKAKAVAQRWAVGKAEKEVAISKAERRRLLKEIVDLYAKLNAHPRSLELIQKYRNWLDEPNELYAKYSKQWKAVAFRRSFGSVARHLVVFGVKVTDAVDPTTIRIPFACEPTRLREVKAKVTDALRIPDSGFPDSGTGTACITLARNGGSVVGETHREHPWRQGGFLHSRGVGERQSCLGQNRRPEGAPRCQEGVRSSGWFVAPLAWLGGS